MEVWESYQQDLVPLIATISAKLTTDAHECRGDLRKALFRRIEMELEEADEIVGQMEIEVRTADQDKATLQAKLREYKSSLARHKGELKGLISTADRDDLLSTPSSPHTAIDMPERSSSTSPSSAQAQRSRLLSATDKLSDGQRRLEDSHRVALETEGLGAGILRDLRGQRDTLLHTRDNLYEADGTIDRASSTLKKMVYRMYQQRAVTYAIIAVLVFLILWVLFSKIF